MQNEEWGEGGGIIKVRSYYCSQRPLLSCSCRYYEDSERRDNDIMLAAGYPRPLLLLSNIKHQVIKNMVVIISSDISSVAAGGCEEIISNCSVEATGIYDGIFLVIDIDIYL